MANKSKNDKFKRYVVYGLMGVAIIFLFSQIIRRAYQTTGVDVSSLGLIDKKKREKAKIKSLSGGSRPSDYEKIVIY